jgi:tRNA A-37 threonylcarbamoyl transferase component Bud32
MGLTDRQAADLRKEDAVSKAYQTLIRHKQSNRQQPGLGFHNGLTEAVRELRKDLVEIYAELDGAGEEPLRAELVKVIGDRLSAFIQSSVAGERGLYAATAARQGARLKSMSTVGIERDLDLAVHARTKRETLSAAPAPPAAPVRLKADSEGDLLEQDEEDQSGGSFRSEYELVEKVNIGAFADVWRAKDPFGRTVAAKIVRSSMAEQSSALEHAKALARAEHPNVVRLYTIARIEDPETRSPVDAIIMEFLDGEDLEERFGRAFTRAEVRQYGQELIEGVEHIHAQHLAHGDLHEGNVMVTARGLKVIDILYMDTLALLSTASREQRLRADLRRTRDMLTSMLEKCVEISPEAAAVFERGSRGNLSFEALRSALMDALALE